MWKSGLLEFYYQGFSGHSNLEFLRPAGEAGDDSDFFSDEFAVEAEGEFHGRHVLAPGRVGDERAESGGNGAGPVVSTVPVEDGGGETREVAPAAAPSRLDHEVLVAVVGVFAFPLPVCKRLGRPLAAALASAEGRIARHDRMAINRQMTYKFVSFGDL